MDFDISYQMKIDIFGHIDTPKMIRNLHQFRINLDIYLQKNEKFMDSHFG